MSARRAVLAAATLAALLLLPTAAVADAAGVRTGDSARIDRWVKERMAAHGIPGSAVAVVRGGHVIHLTGYGTADRNGREVTAQTAFLIGSVSKPFTAVVVGQLVEEGLWSWDEPVWPHLAHLADAPPAGFERVTVEHLLTHTGGLGMSAGVAGAVELHDGPDALDRRAADLLADPLRFAPGERWEYSNAGPTLLAAAVEGVTGHRFADQLRARVFDPLGMTGSFATEHDPRATALATGHQLWFGRWRPAALPYDSAGVAMGYIGSTAQDLAAFMQAHLHGHPAIPATAEQIADGPVTPTGWATPLDAGYGRGWFVDELAGHQVISHTGSLGHFTAHVVLVPDADDLGIAVLTNASAFVAAGHEGQYDLGLGLTRLLIGEVPQPTDRGMLLTLVVPAAAWAAVAFLLAAIARHLNTLRRAQQDHARRAAPNWMRRLVPGAVLLVVGAGTLAAVPLGTARHFYPDTGWALTLIAYIATAWGVARLLLAAPTTRLSAPASAAPTTPNGARHRAASGAHATPTPRHTRANADKTRAGLAGKDDIRHYVPCQALTSSTIKPGSAVSLCDTIRGRGPSGQEPCCRRRLPWGARTCCRRRGSGRIGTIAG